MTNRDHARRLLQCLTVANRPLRVEELDDILALNFDEGEGATPTLNKDWRWEDRQQAVLPACSSLVTLVEDGDSRVIQFSHFSVKEFLTSDRISTSQGDTSHFHIMVEPAHTTLAQACLRTLLQLDGNSDNNQVAGIFPLAKYASQHWVEHAQFGIVTLRIEDSLRRLFDSTKPYFAAWLQLHDMNARRDINDFEIARTTNRGLPLNYALLCGFRNLAAHIIVEHPEQVNARGGFLHSPLVAALSMGQFKTTGNTGHTLLRQASRFGYVDIVRLLLQHGADVGTQDEGYSIPLHLASSRGELEVARLLLDYLADVDAMNKDGRTPLHLASSSGRVEIVHLLLDHSVNTNAKDKDGRTPLYEALSQGKPEIVRLLLDRGADANAGDKDGWTPLHNASCKGETETVCLLLDRGANTTAEDKDRWTPLHLASCSGRVEIVRLLLERGTNADLKNRDGRTPFHKVSSQGRTAIMRLLLNRGADANNADKDGRTPLHKVSSQGRTEIMRLLLDCGRQYRGQGWMDAVAPSVV